MLLENGWGRIINISSTIGRLVFTFGQSNYAAAKVGVIGFTKALAVEVARNNITVNVVAIGAMGTEMWGTVADQIKEKVYEKIPIHRTCTTQEAARGVRFLVVEGAYITGHAPEHERRHLLGLTQADVIDLPYRPKRPECIT
jgi:acetoacetyl-CoA reductase